MTDRRSITLPLCVLGAGAVHGLCVAVMLPMLITLPGPGGSAPPAIDVEVLQPAPVLPKQLADPATTSALPKMEFSPAESASEPAKPEEAVEPATAQPSPEAAPDDMPQQITSPDAAARLPLDLPAPEPLVPTFVMAPALAPPPLEEVKQVTAEPDVTTTSSIIPVATNPEAENLGQAADEPSAPPAPQASEPDPETEPQPEVARADPNEETPAQAAHAEDSTEAETPPSPPVAKPAASKKPAPQAAPKVKAPAKSEAKAEPAAAKKRPAVTAKRPAPQTRRVAKGRTQAPMSQGIMSLFGGGLKPQAGAAASARRPAAQRQ